MEQNSKIMIHTLICIMIGYLSSLVLTNLSSKFYFFVFCPITVTLIGMMTYKLMEKEARE